MLKLSSKNILNSDGTYSSGVVLFPATFFNIKHLNPKKKKKKLRLRGIRNKGKEGKKKFCTKEMGSQNPITTPKPSGSELSGAQKLRQKELIGTT